MIVGESDGSVLANRLSADSRCRVLLQETLRWPNFVIQNP